MKEKISFSLDDLARRTGGKLIPQSEGKRIISGFTTLEIAGENDISFLTSKRFRKQAHKSKACAIILPDGMEVTDKIIIQVPQVWKSVVCLMNLFYPESKANGTIHNTAVIHPGAKLGVNVTIGPYSIIENGVTIGDQSVIGALCYVGENVTIGKHCLIHPNTTILKNCELGNRIILNSGAVIGSDGFKYEMIDGIPTKIPQVGRVVLEDDVEIGSNTCIDRASLTETRIGRGSKLDNLIQIAHNVEIGSYCIIAGQTGIAGSTKVGNGCIMGGQVGIRDNITLGDQVMIGAKSGIVSSFPSGSKLFGHVAISLNDSLKREAALNRLPQIIRTLKNLEKQIRQLEENSRAQGEEK